MLLFLGMQRPAIHFARPAEMSFFLFLDGAGLRVMMFFLIVGPF